MYLRKSVHTKKNFILSVKSFWWGSCRFIENILQVIKNMLIWKNLREPLKTWNSSRQTCWITTLFVLPLKDVMECSILPVPSLLPLYQILRQAFTSFWNFSNRIYMDLVIPFSAKFCALLQARFCTWYIYTQELMML